MDLVAALECSRESGADSGFSFPILQAVPLTARSTVTQASSGVRKPVTQPVMPSNLEHRKKVLPWALAYASLRRALGLQTPLEKGYSQVDWLRLARATPPLALRKDITVAEVKRHNTVEDAWMIFRNRVYNLTPYLRFHPGGADILGKVAGKDGTSLFMKYHPWVNIDALMEKCLIGLLDEAPTISPGSKAAQVIASSSTAPTKPGPTPSPPTLAPSQPAAACSAPMTSTSPGDALIRGIPPGAAHAVFERTVTNEFGDLVLATEGKDDSSRSDTAERDALQLGALL